MKNRKIDCPGTGDWFSDLPPGELLDRSLLDSGFEAFMRPWILRAKKARDQEKWFEALIYLWVTFNAWLAQVAADRQYSERDSYLVQASGLDPDFIKRFECLLQTDKNFHKLVTRFHDLWPVFKVRALVDNGIGLWQERDLDESRAEYRASCFSSMKLHRGDYAPRCYLEHQPDNLAVDGGNPDLVPLDWRHTLSAIYQVRCNLFHGGKSFLISRDKDFVRMSYMILQEVWFGEDSLKVIGYPGRK